MSTICDVLLVKRAFSTRFAKDFALIARLLTDLLKSKFEWKWTEEHTKAFEILKQKLVERRI